MEKTNNLYIDALKYGINKMQKGLTFDELHKHLTEELKWKFEKDFLDYFRLWFYRNFYNRDISLNLIHGTEAAIKSAVSQISAYDQIKCLITAEAYPTFSIATIVL